MSELENIAGQKQYLEQAIAALDARISSIHTTLRAISNSIEVVKSLNREGASDALCYAGPNIMFRAKIVEPDTVLMNIGADVVVEKSAEDAINDCEGKIKESQIALDNLINARYQNAMQLAAINQRLADMVKAQS